jgi:3alpha(or 20beta)-hydroxysteroid dehydrogenase
LTNSLEGMVVIVSGAASGIGAATAIAAARNDANVILGDLDADRANMIATDIGKQAAGRYLDVSDQASWASLSEFVLDRHERIDGLVNCAGIATGHSLRDTTGEELSRVLWVNTIGPLLGIRATIDAMQMSDNASVVNVSSCAGLTGLRSNIAYTISKFGIRGLTKSLVHELGALGIRINSVFPGYIDTPMARPDWTDFSQAGRRPAKVALGRTGRPEEIADVICFLLSREASYCTGAEFVSDGGLSSVLPARGDDE